MVANLKAERNCCDRSRSRSGGSGEAMWHEARRSERKVHDMMDAARKRAQRRAVFLAKRRGDPQQSIQLVGTRCRMYRDDGLYQASEDQQGLIPWNGKQDVLIDRFDGRALLDFIRESGSRHFRAQEKSEEEEELEECVNFERYRDLIKHRRRGFTDEEGLQHVDQEMEAKRKLTRKERRKVSQIEREREREAARITGTRVLHHDPYRESRRSPTYEAYSRSRRSRSRSRSPSYSRRYPRGRHSDDVHRSKPVAPKIEYITEFGGSGDSKETKLEGFSPPSSPSQADVLNRSEHSTFNSCKDRLDNLYSAAAFQHFVTRGKLVWSSSGHILEALHVDPASGVSVNKDKGTKVPKPSVSTSSALAKLTKGSTSGGPLKQQEGEKKETPQERLKRIMSRQLNKQIKKDSAAEMAKKREQERQRMEKLAETNRLSRYRRRSRSRSYSRSPPRRYRRTRSPSRSRGSRRYNSRSPSRSWSPSRSRSRTRTRSRSRSRSPSHPHSRSPRVRSRSRY
ncbi:Suppressor of white apricot N-terminal domain containing protein [Trema orientale]|uniref:Suppressor of white apricot N-terminal domain containing protein n=1 Tax=Trema orientale TaxID=63057 RepID=A0A2P5FYG1_TREOI|nr:Suppressor of white apricot N-terminal domain containing protein [Trema orientale]